MKRRKGGGDSRRWSSLLRGQSSVPIPRRGEKRKKERKKRERANGGRGGNWEVGRGREEGGTLLPRVIFKRNGKRRGCRESEDSIDARDAASSVQNPIRARGFMHVPRWNVEQKKLSSCWWLFNGTSDCINKRSSPWAQPLGEDAIRRWDSIPHARSIFDQLAAEFPVSHFGFN